MDNDMDYSKIRTTYMSIMDRAEALLEANQTARDYPKPRHRHDPLARRTRVAMGDHRAGHGLSRIHR